jgi:hypothetical protein
MISSIAKAIMDTLQFHFDKSIFRKLGNWWNPLNSWENKYKWFPNSKILTWIISNPIVLITDAWHFFGFIRDFALFSCIPIAMSNYWVFLLYPIYRIIFHILYTWILTL